MACTYKGHSDWWKTQWKMVHNPLLYDFLISYSVAFSAFSAQEFNLNGSLDLFMLALHFLLQLCPLINNKSLYLAKPSGRSSYWKWFHSLCHCWHTEISKQIFLLKNLSKREHIELIFHQSSLPQRNCLQHIKFEQCRNLSYKHMRMCSETHTEHKCLVWSLNESLIIL